MTTLTASPMSPLAQGSPVTLTATVTPAAAGMVQFKDGTANLGSPVAVSNGTAVGSAPMLAVGSHQLTAVFTPTDSTAFSSSTSAPVTVMVTAPTGAMTTSTALSTSPASTVAQGSPVTLTAMITPAAAGTVQFKDGTANLGNPVIVSNGAASGITSTLAVGSHQLTAVFTPTSPAAFSSSTSPVVPLTVTGAGGGLLQLTVPQQSGLALDVQVSVLGDRTSNLDGGTSVLDVSMPILDDRGAVLDGDGRLAVLDGHGLLNGVVTVVLGQR